MILWRGTESFIRAILHQESREGKMWSTSSKKVWKEKIRFSLRGRASDVAYEMTTEELKGKQGAKALLDRLDGVYKKDKLTEMYGKLRQYLKI